MVFIRKKLIEDNSQSKTLDNTEVVEAELNETEPKTYELSKILGILSDYMSDFYIEQYEDYFMTNYPDGMNSEAINELITDIAESFDEETANKVKARIDELQNNSSFDNSNFEEMLNNTVEQYNNGSISKLEYIGQVGTLVKDFINSLSNVSEDKREELFNKAEELINNIIK